MRNGNQARMLSSRSADMQQAAYFHDLLTQERAEMAENLDEHRIALTQYEHAADLSGSRRQRRIIRTLEAEMRTVDRMLKALTAQLDSPVRSPF